MSIVDLHVHTAPSLLPRHHRDDEVGAVLEGHDVTTFVLKAHEGSTAERAALAGGGAVGGIVLNASVGGANPSAVEVAARLGARVAWMPTISAETHRRSRTGAHVQVHGAVDLPDVPVCNGNGVRPEWRAVFDVAASHDMVLASGHLSMDEAVAVFSAAREHGVSRFLVNHPLLDFLGWRPEHVDALRRLNAHLEVGVLADRLDPDGSATARLLAVYPEELLVFGSDLGHCAFPDVDEVLPDWFEHACATFGASTVEAITHDNGLRLLGL